MFPQISSQFTQIIPQLFFDPLVNYRQTQLNIGQEMYSNQLRQLQQIQQADLQNKLKNQQLRNQYTQSNVDENRKFVNSVQDPILNFKMREFLKKIPDSDQLIFTDPDGFRNLVLRDPGLQEEFQKFDLISKLDKNRFDVAQVNQSRANSSLEDITKGLREGKFDLGLTTLQKENLSRDDRRIGLQAFNAETSRQNSNINALQKGFRIDKGKYIFDEELYNTINQKIGKLSEGDKKRIAYSDIISKLQKGEITEQEAETQLRINGISESSIKGQFGKDITTKDTEIMINGSIQKSDSGGEKAGIKVIREAGQKWLRVKGDSETNMKYLNKIYQSKGNVKSYAEKIDGARWDSNKNILWIPEDTKTNTQPPNTQINKNINTGGAY